MANRETIKDTINRRETIPRSSLVAPLLSMFDYKVRRRLALMIHTVLVSSDRDRITRRSVTYAGPGQYPNPVLGPFFQFVQHESRVIQFDNFRLRVGASALDDLQLVVRDPPVRSIGRRWFPCYQYGGRADRLSAYIARRSPGDCITLSYRGGRGEKTKTW